WYLSSETFLEVARIAPAADFGQPIEAGRTYFLDFRPVSGLMIPYRIEKEYGIRFRSYDVDSVEVNPELTADTFSFPRPEAMADLPVRPGAWRVDVEWPTPRPGAPWAKTTTSAMIEELFHGALLEAELTFDQAGDIRRLRHTWSHDRFRNTYLETVFDNLTFRHTLLEGALTDGTLVTSTLDTGTVLDLGGQQLHLRQATSRTDTEGFQILQETSADGGETWQEALRLTFTPSTTATDEPEGR
ncbi:MAG: DUF1579 family protein, partial [Acidobacteria bacterium]|nr:DUF1579 family protein [Acidobacteriota bacterium]